MAGNGAKGGVAAWAGVGNRAVRCLCRVIAPARLAFVKVGLLVRGGFWPLVCLIWARYLRRYVTYCLAPPF